MAVTKTQQPQPKQAQGLKENMMDHTDPFNDPDYVPQDASAGFLRRHMAQFYESRGLQHPAHALQGAEL